MDVVVAVDVLGDRPRELERRRALRETSWEEVVVAALEIIVGFTIKLNHYL